MSLPSLTAAASLIATTTTATALLAIRTAWRCGGFVIEALSHFSHDATTDEALERAQRRVIFWSDEADRIPNGVSATRTTDPMHVVFGVHREIKIHHM